MGENILNLLPEDSIIRKSRKETLYTVFPATTAVVFNTVATCEYPAIHGITGRH